jgi:hypothetical protein
MYVSIFSCKGMFSFSLFFFLSALPEMSVVLGGHHHVFVKEFTDSQIPKVASTMDCSNACMHAIIPHSIFRGLI